MPGALEVSIGPRTCSPKLHQLSFAGRFCDLVEKLGEKGKRRGRRIALAPRSTRHDPIPPPLSVPFLLSFSALLAQGRARRGRQLRLGPAESWVCIDNASAAGGIRRLWLRKRRTKRLGKRARLLLYLCPRDSGYISTRAVRSAVHTFIHYRIIHQPPTAPPVLLANHYSCYLSQAFHCADTTCGAALAHSSPPFSSRFFPCHHFFLTSPPWLLCAFVSAAQSS